MFTAQQAVDLFVEQLGYHEVGNNWTKFAKELDAVADAGITYRQNHAWCATVVRWVLWKGGVSDSLPFPCFTTRWDWATARQRGELHPLSEARIGDIVWFGREDGVTGDENWFAEGHVGMATSNYDAAADRVDTIEGNSDNEVRHYSGARRRPSAQIIGVYHPAYADAASVAPAAPIVPVDLGAIAALIRGTKYGHDGNVLVGLRAQGWAVKCVQAMLNDAGANLEIDGDFGPITRAAVVRFQRERGLRKTGVVSRPVWLALGLASD